MGEFVLIFFWHLPSLSHFNYFVICLIYELSSACCLEQHLLKQWTTEPLWHYLTWHVKQIIKSCVKFSCSKRRPIHAPISKYIGLTNYIWLRLNICPKPKCVYWAATACIGSDRVVFKWLSKVITWLRSLHLVIGLKESSQIFNQWEAKAKPITPCTSHFSHALSSVTGNC